MSLCIECPVRARSPCLLFHPSRASELASLQLHLTKACGRLVQENLLNAHLDLSCASQQPSTSTSNLSVGPEAQGSSQSSTSSKAKPWPQLSKRKGHQDSSSSRSTSSSNSNKRLKTAAPPAAPGVKSSATLSGSAALEAAKPLAELVRPRLLGDVVGQEHLLGPDAGLLRHLILQDRLGSIILWGPPGTGKTTLAKVVANTTSSSFREVSATSSSAADVRKIFDEAANMLKLTGKKTVLFVDEVQRFTKAQQDLFLPYIEAGLISCIFATTENPSFRLQSALLSRCRVFTLEKLKPEECFRILKRALSIRQEAETAAASTSASSIKPEEEEEAAEVKPAAVIDEELLHFLAQAADGDARTALNSLELALAASEGGATIDHQVLKDSLKKAHLLYDRVGDAHYDTISALHKSVRGSDANAALYWLARMLEGGEDPLYVARRVVRMASEDIGSADPSALPLAMSAYQACQVIGMPECDCILAQAVVHLAEAPKSVRVYKAYGAAKSLVRGEQNYSVPLHIRNAPTKLMKELDYGKEYRYEPSYAHPVHQTFLPPELEGRCGFIEPSDDSIKGKVVSEELLAEWEHKVQQGRPWEGRARLESFLRDAQRDAPEP